MKVHVKMFSIPGICEASREMEFALCEGDLKELLNLLQEEVGDAPLPLDNLLILHNGRALVKNENAQFSDGDDLWILPQISGG